MHRLIGLALLPYCLLQWSTWGCTWGWRFDGRRESLAWRLSLAWTMWRHRYWIRAELPSTPTPGGKG